MNLLLNDTNSILFAILLCFCLINFFVNGILQYLFKKSIYKTLCFFWITLGTVYVLQACVPNRVLPVALGFSFSFIPTFIFARVVFDSLGASLSVKKYSLCWLACFPVTLTLYWLKLPFAAVAMPFSLLTAAPMLHAGYMIFFPFRQAATPLHKFLGIYCCIAALHALNFALFRMVEGSQVWGWLLSYGLYQVPGVLLPAFTLAELSRKEKESLAKMVTLRTEQLGLANSSLQQALQRNIAILKNVMHDLANPLFVLMSYAGYFNCRHDPGNEEAIAKITNSTAMMQDMLMHIRDTDVIGRSAHLDGHKPIDFSECAADAAFLFQDRFRQKQVAIQLTNELPREVRLRGDKSSFTFSVLNNIVSNCLKFSLPGGSVAVLARMKNPHEAVIEFRDRGTGIAPAVMENIFDMNRAVSLPGTQGETGNGFGLPLVKLYVESYGGSISIDSRDIERHPQTHGTTVAITLPVV